jgi:hypothetical protein
MRAGHTNCLPVRSINRSATPEAGLPDRIIIRIDH